MKNIILATLAISFSSLSAASAGDETPGYETRIVRQSTINQNADANHPKGRSSTELEGASASAPFTNRILLDRPTAVFSYHDRPEALGRDDIGRTNSIRANADR